MERRCLPMNKILVSACLLGERVRYDGSENLVDHWLLEEWKAQGRLVIFCPEVAGGLGTPRLPAEISDGGGVKVLTGKAKVYDNSAYDVTEAFILGAQKALSFAQQHQVKIAILKEGSPSCGSSSIYDGSFSGLKIRGQGVTSALFDQHGIRVFNEQGMLAAEQYLEMLDKTYLGNS